MGGYAAYVWPAYGITIMMLAGLLVSTLSGLRRRQAMIEALEAARPTRRRRPASTDPVSAESRPDRPSPEDHGS